MGAMNQEVVISHRFRGPPNSANGGYACGVVAAGIEGDAVVTLRLPPPLDHPMTLSSDGSESRLLDGEALVGEASTADLELDVPEAPSLEEAADASRRYAGFDFHPFEECFVCGPNRDEGDGLRIFPGRLLEGGPSVAPWAPHASLGTPEGLIDRRHVWAALDCPSYFGLDRLPLALLGRLTTQIDRVPRVGEQLISMGWEIDVDGRKHRAGSALVTPDGEVLARGLATWIELSGPSPK